MGDQKSKDKIIKNEDSENDQYKLPEILDVPDIAELFRVSKATVIDLIKEKKIPAFKIAQGKYLVSSKQLIKHIEDNTGNY